MGSVRNGEVVLSAPATKRRSRSKRERREIVEETLQPGASVAVIARQHGVNANQVFHWRKLYREGRLDVVAPSAQLLPVRIAEVASAAQGPKPNYPQVRLWSRSVEPVSALKAS